MGTDRRDARGDGGVRARARTRASVARFESVRRARGDVRARSESAAASDGDDGDASAGASCDLEFMKMVRDDADKPTTGYALQVAIFGSCVVAAVMLFVAFDLGSSTFMMDAKSRIVGALAKSGFTAAFALIFVSELGDKTFFIAALLAMRLGRLRVLAGATTALATMTVISVAIGRAFQNLPSSLAPTLPIGEYAAVAMLVFFGVNTLMDALAMEFLDDSFDMVWACESGEHMPDKKRYVEEMVRVLKPGGTLVIATWCQRHEPPALTTEEKSKLQFLYDEWAHPYFISIKDYCSLAENTGAMTQVQSDDWTKQTIVSWRHSIWAGVYDPLPVFSRPKIWYKTLRDIICLERATHALEADDVSQRLIPNLRP